MILISPYPRPLRNGKRNPKEYPWWPQLVPLLLEGRAGPLLQAGGGAPIPGAQQIETTLADVRSLLEECEFWVAVDNFLQHMAHQIPKPGIVLWGRSDPRIFGYPENVNLLKDRKQLRERQFDIWETVPYAADIFPKPVWVANAALERWPLHEVAHA